MHKTHEKVIFKKFGHSIDRFKEKEGFNQDRTSPRKYGSLRQTTKQVKEIRKLKEQNCSLWL